MTFLINQAIFVLINTLMAGRDAIKIREHKTIDHFNNGLMYLLSIVVSGMIFRLNIGEFVVFTISCFCNRQLFFDIPLNLIRKLKWYYVPEKPESFVDKIEAKVFGKNGKVPVYVYAVAFLLSIIINNLIS